MDRTGIGYAGIVGAWWLPAATPFALHARLADELEEIARAIFALFDAVTGLYGTAAGAACGLDALLNYKVPADIPRLVGSGRVLGVRPDFQLRPLARPPYYQLVATELEICPSAHGFAHAMQAVYGVPTDLVDAFIRQLDGRELLFAGSSQWSEFLFEQLAFCQALAERGARGRVLFDLPIAAIDARVRAGECWRPPIFGVDALPARWHADVLGRIRAHGFERFVWPDAPEWPADVGDAVVFRFGYFDCFAPERLQRLLQWQARGATPLNPTSFILDSKVILAALRLPAVRRLIAADELAVLDRCIPETILLDPGAVERVRDERDAWVVKYAGYDRGNQAWGGRSLRIGALCAAEEWAGILHTCAELPWPVVAQRAVPTARVDIDYLDAHELPQTMRGGATRLRSFMLRADTERDAVMVGGTHLTVAGGTLQVSEGTAAVQAPVRFS
jgi:hypothetical protein